MGACVRKSAGIPRAACSALTASAEVALIVPMRFLGGGRPTAYRPGGGSVKFACLLAAVTLCTVAAVGGLTYKCHQRELENTVGTQLLNIARVTALAVDPALHPQAQRSLDSRSAAYPPLCRLRASLTR